MRETSTVLLEMNLMFIVRRFLLGVPMLWISSLITAHEVYITLYKLNPLRSNLSNSCERKYI